MWAAFFSQLDHAYANVPRRRSRRAGYDIAAAWAGAGRPVVPIGTGQPAAAARPRGLTAAASGECQSDGRRAAPLPTRPQIGNFAV